MESIQDSYLDLGGHSQVPMKANYRPLTLHRLKPWVPLAWTFFGRTPEAIQRGCPCVQWFQSMLAILLPWYRFSIAPQSCDQKNKEPNNLSQNWGFFVVPLRSYHKQVISFNKGLRQAPCYVTLVSCGSTRGEVAWTGLLRYRLVSFCVSF